MTGSISDRQIEALGDIAKGLQAIAAAVAVARDQDIRPSAFWTIPGRVLPGDRIEGADLEKVLEGAPDGTQVIDVSRNLWQRFSKGWAAPKSLGDGSDAPSSYLAGRGPLEVARIGPAEEAQIAAPVPAERPGSGSGGSRTGESVDGDPEGWQPLEGAPWMEWRRVDRTVRFRPTLEAGHPLGKVIGVVRECGTEYFKSDAAVLQRIRDAADGPRPETNETEDLDSPVRASEAIDEALRKAERETKLAKGGRV